MAGKNQLIFYHRWYSFQLTNTDEKGHRWHIEGLIIDQKNHSRNGRQKDNIDQKDTEISIVLAIFFFVCFHRFYGIIFIPCII